jgi:putative ABC transport system substrate-binding protein
VNRPPSLPTMPLSRHTNRREFISLLGGATMWPLAAQAQQADVPVIGFLQSLSSEIRRPEISAFHRGLGEVGYVEGRNVTVQYRFADGHFDRLPALAADLVQRQVTVILSGTNVTTRAVMATTQTIPVVFTAAGDPVKLGFVSSLNRPGGNITGVTNLANLLMAKNMELLNEVVPGSAPVGYLINPENPNAEADLSDVQGAARALNRQLIVVNARGEADLDQAFVTFAQRKAGGLLVGADPLFIQWRDRLIAMSERYALPATYPLPEFAKAGGLMSYASSNIEANRLAGTYVGRILKGEKPGDLPVQQSTRIAFVINLKTAKTLGVNFPLPLLARADEVIE